MTESELITEFGEDGWYQLEDESIVDTASPR